VIFRVLSARDGRFRFRQVGDEQHRGLLRGRRGIDIDGQLVGSLLEPDRHAVVAGLHLLREMAAVAAQDLYLPSMIICGVATMRETFSFVYCVCRCAETGNPKRSFQPM